MYKKITHNIVEEHFDGHTSLEQPIKNKIPTTTIFNEATFKNEVDLYVTKYAENIINLTNQLTGTEDELINAFEKAFVNIDDLGNITKNFYPSDLGERLNISMRSFALLTFIAVTNIKLGRDPQNNFNRMNINVADLAAIISTFNSLWNNIVLRNLFQRIVLAVGEKLKARKEKNASAEQIADSTILSQFKVFGDAVSGGIISKFPERFTQTSTSFDRNIM